MNYTNVKVKEVVKYGWHSLSANGSVNFTLKAAYSELTNSIKLMQMLNNDVNIKAKIPGEKAMKLGMFRIKEIKVEGDGESIIKFNSLNDYTEMDNLNYLPIKGSENEEFAVMMSAEIEIEKEGEENDDEE